jgi:hypothetical protein
MLIETNNNSEQFSRNVTAGGLHLLIDAFRILNYMPPYHSAVAGQSLYCSLLKLPEDNLLLKGFLHHVKHLYPVMNHPTCKKMKRINDCTAPGRCKAHHPTNIQ